MRATIVGDSGRTRWTALAAIVVISITNVAASGRDDDDDADEHAYAIGLWGDLPYSDVQETGVQNLIKDMNKRHLAFTVHDGDLKQGNGLPVCDDALYTKALGYFNSLKAPAMFTPGDNDWTDCDRPNNGGFDSLERLSHERQVFFSDDDSLGQHTLHQKVQTDSLCLGGSNASPTPEGCVENRRWTVGRVTYATLNIQGSCNNLCGVGFNEAEYAARNAANIQWMEETFEEAASRHSLAIMLISQADPGFSQFEFDAPLRDPKTLAQTSGPSSMPAAANFDGFKDFLVALRAKVIAFGRPVDYVHGDSHYFRIDKPLMDPTGVNRLQNFTRVETFGNHAESGNNDVQWVKVLVDPGTPEVFAYQPQIIPANQAGLEELLPLCLAPVRVDAPPSSSNSPKRSDMGHSRRERIRAISSRGKQNASGPSLDEARPRRVARRVGRISACASAATPSSVLERHEGVALREPLGRHPVRRARHAG